MNFLWVYRSSAIRTSVSSLTRFYFQTNRVDDWCFNWLSFWHNGRVDILILSKHCYVQLKKKHPRFIKLTTSTWFLLRAEALFIALDRSSVDNWDREPRLSLYFVLNDVFRCQEPLCLDAVVAATSGTGRCHDGFSLFRLLRLFYGLFVTKTYVIKCLRSLNKV